MTTTDSLSEGDRAPNFTLHTDEAQPWELSDHLDQPVVLLFFPGAFTRVCTTELNTVNNDLGSFEPAHVAGISTDSPAVLSEFRSTQQLEFPLLSDHNADVCADYGAKYDHNFTDMGLDRIAKRSAFIVDQSGTIRHAEILDDAGQQPDFDALKRTVQGLNGS
ncbi:redoxin domain-containing protein [Salinibacter altiplanensis]|uniref:redoxin domain-containing protein n=1 Tax=Salinibacter altiplanensis TaxID=1803181 RepID=UPI000C9EFC59|nr:redoxin domain-containing protein [Salinibacter altiplanensis]